MKGDNILFNKVKQIPIIIDFGISIPFKELKILKVYKIIKNIFLVIFLNIIYGL